MARQAGRARRGHHGGGFPDRVRPATSRRCRRSAGELPVKVAALARCTAQDIERAAQALEKAKAPPRIHTFLATSDIHLKYKLKKTRAQVLEEAAKAVELARKYVDDVEFSAEDGGRTEVGYLIDVSRAVVAAGAGTVNIPDTVGYAIPEEYGALIGQVAKALGDNGHCQRSLPQRSGPRGRELAGGDPERRAPGRVHGQRHRRARGQLLARGDRDGAGDAPRSPARITTGIKTDAALPGEPAADRDHRRRACSRTRRSSARNAFAHEAGIHQDGFLKERTTYEIIDPKTVGVPESRLVLGKHSGRHALRARCDGARDRARQGRARRALHPLHRAGRPQEGHPGRGDP